MSFSQISEPFHFFVIFLIRGLFSFLKQTSRPLFFKNVQRYNELIAPLVHKLVPDAHFSPHSRISEKRLNQLVNLAQFSTKTATWHADSAEAGMGGNRFCKNNPAVLTVQPAIHF